MSCNLFSRQQMFEISRLTRDAAAEKRLVGNPSLAKTNKLE